MNNSNGNGNTSNQTTSEASIVQAVAELKEAVGLLWRRVDQAEAVANRESQKTQEKLDTWIQTNLTIIESSHKMTEAIVLNSQESRKSIEFFEKGTQQSAILSNQLQQFGQLTNQLQQILIQPSRTSNLSTSPSLQALSNQLHGLQASIDLIQNPADPTLKEQMSTLQSTLSKTSQTVNSVEVSTNTIKNFLTNLKSNKKKAGTWISNVWVVGGLVALGSAILMGLLSIKWDSNYLVDHVNQIIWKLQAIEKRVGQ